MVYGSSKKIFMQGHVELTVVYHGHEDGSGAVDEVGRTFCESFDLQEIVLLLLLHFD